MNDPVSVGAILLVSDAAFEPATTVVAIVPSADKEIPSESVPEPEIVSVVPPKPVAGKESVANGRYEEPSANFRPAKN